MPSLPILDDIPITVTTIAELRALVNHRNNEIVRVRSTENDFRFDSSSPALDDGISTVKPINVNMLAPGRWLVVVYPVNLNVTGWTVLFTRKVAAGTASDGGFVDTGIVYDPAYEYLTLNRLVAAPTPSPTVAASIASFYIAPNTYGTYKPDGVNTLAVTAGLLNVLILSQQDPTALQAAAGWGTATGAEMQIDAAGKIYTQWTRDMAKDGHFCIARRRRYG